MFQTTHQVDSAIEATVRLDIQVRTRWSRQRITTDPYDSHPAEHEEERTVSGGLIVIQDRTFRLPHDLARQIYEAFQKQCDEQPLEV